MEIADRQIEGRTGTMKISGSVTRVLFMALMVIGAECVGLQDGNAMDTPKLAKAYFAGGCFWCMEEAFEKVEGVVEVVSGYMGGTVKNPSYEDVSSGRTGHAESVEVRYDSSKVTYTQLLETFWRNVDPLTADAQFCDHGNQYRAVIFFQGDEQQRAAQESKQAIEQSKRFTAPLVTEVTSASEFYPAEEYHQDFYKKNPIRYKYYKFTCGRAQRLETLWGKS